MLNFKEFKDYLSQNLTELSDKLPDMKPEPVTRNDKGQNREGFYFPTGNITPVIYYDELYDTYKNHEPEYYFDMDGQKIQAAVSKAESLYEDRIDLQRKMDIHSDTLVNKDNIYMKVINTNANETLLSNVPHRDVLDLSVTYRMFIWTDGKILSSFLIDYDKAAALGLSEEDLYRTAQKNGQRLFPAQIMPMKDMLKEFSPDIDIYEIDTPDMYVITNTQRIDGAAVMLYDNVLDDVAQITGGDLIVIPSSIHELIAVNADNPMSGLVEDMIYDTNSEMVSPEDRLSNHAYYYNASEKTLTFASDNPVPEIDEEPEINLEGPRF